MRNSTMLQPWSVTETIIEMNISQPASPSETPISNGRAHVRSHKPARGRCHLAWSSLMSGWRTTTFCTMLALSSPGWTQATLHTPVASDPQCLEHDCATAPRASEVGGNPTPGELGNQAGVAQPSDGTLSIDNKNGQEHGLNPERNWPPKEPFPFKVDATREPAPNEFQEFVASSVGRKLPIYGHSLFYGVPTTFSPVDRIPVTDDYRIGPGDEILIRAWGQIDLNAKLAVDRNGEVFLPKVGALSVTGLQYHQLPEYFRTAIGRVFRNFDLTVSLGQLRSVQVFVVGEARRPGSYTVSSLCTLVNALFASGGPSAAGSMRHIQLKRDNRVITEFDFYDLLLQGDKSKDTRLLPGDVIYIPPARSSIAIAGSVNVPAIYELREGTSLGSAIELAGGLATTADGQKVMVERIENRSTRRVEEFPLDGPGLQRTLQDGDVVRIFSLSPHFENAVTLRGNVAHPGRTEWHSGMRLKDVIPNQQALVTRDYWRSANGVVNMDDKGGPQSDQQSVSAKEATESTTMKLHNQLARNAPEINWDYAVIQRLNPEDLTARLIPFDLGKLVLKGEEQSNLALQPGDVITIFSQNDLAVPLQKQSKFVRLEREFRSAGVYQAEAGETVRHLIARVGGFTPNAYLFGAKFTRESVRVAQQRGLDQLIEKLEEDISRNALAPSGVGLDEVADQRAKLEAQRHLVEKLREVKATGRVVLDLVPRSTEVADLPEIALEDGDRLLISNRPATVEILGAVYNKNSFLYRREQRLDDYLKRAGGPTRDADTSRMFVIRADGSILGKQSVTGLWNDGFASLRLMPGDAIVVPERLNRGSVLKAVRDWSQVFSQFALGAAAVRVLQ